MSDPISQVMLSMHGWLNRLLSRRDLPTPDQRPLYAYQLNADEYSELLVRLREIGGRDGAARDPAICAAFCLFCAEWYRREYRVEDGWSWDAIWKRLGYEFSAPELARIIPKGLDRFWQRPIRFYESERRNFLGSVFSEGGLPFKVLTEPGSRFQTLFAKVLKGYSASDSLAGSIEPVVKYQIEKLNLPQVFLEQTSVELIGRMVDQLAQLVDFFHLENTSNPVDILDVRSPAWRKSFPIPLDNETGRDFLNGLLATASRETRIHASKLKSLSCEHYWLSSLGCLETEITLPSVLTMTVDQQPVSNRFDLSISEGRDMLVSMGPGYGSISASQINIRIRHHKVTFKRKDPSKTLSVVASIGGQPVCCVEVPGSVVDLGSVPVGFDLTGGGSRWLCAGQSSFFCQGQELALFVPDDCQVSSEDCDVIYEKEIYAGLNLWNISGKGRVVCQHEDIFAIRLGVEKASQALIELKGKILEYSTRPSSTYIGLPHIFPDQSATGEVSSAKIFVNNVLADSCHLNERLGTRWLTVKSAEGETWLRRRVGILPADFSIDLKPGNQPNHGYVSFKSGVNCFVEFSTEGVQARRIKESDAIAYELTSASDIPPSQIIARVCPNLEADPVEIVLPFPTLGVVALDGDGNRLPKALSVDELLGTRLHLYARPDRSVRYRMDMRLAGRNASRAYYEWHYRASPERPVQISLYEIRSHIESLLSLEQGIDQKVLITISGDGRDSVFSIRRQTASLSMDWQRNILYSNPNFGVDGKPIRPVLMLLSEPERNAQELPSRRSEGVVTGEFDIPSAVDKNGPWLVVPHRESLVNFRPVFLSGKYEKPSGDEDSRTMQRAVLTFDHHALVSSFTPVLQQMALNPGHSGWQFLKSLYEKYNYLSLGAFEGWKALVKHPEALAMSLYKFGFDPEYMQRLEKDFPIVLEVFPVSILKEASERYWQWMQDQGMPEDLINTHLKPEFLKKLQVVMGMTDPHIAKWLDTGQFPQEFQLPEQIIHGMISTGWYQTLLRNHGDGETWPDDFGTRIKRWCQALNADILGFEPEHDFRNAVVYLPVYLAAVAAGIEHLEALFPNEAEAAFHIRKTRDFDVDWFKSVYQYALLKFISISQKESQ